VTVATIISLVSLVLVLISLALFLIVNAKARKAGLFDELPDGTYILHKVGPGLYEIETKE
jgi:uncharacterized Tic20 family protein